MSDFCSLLSNSKTIAVVGISDKPDRDSGRIAKYLKDKGYTVFGVHPFLTEVFGIQVFKTLKEIPSAIDIVDVFMSSDKVAAITEDVLAVKPKALWLQLGITNDTVISAVAAQGIEGIQDRCIAIEHRRCSM